MSSTIQGTPLQLNLIYDDLDDTTPSPHRLGASDGAFIKAIIESMLPLDQQAILDKILQTPLDSFFDTLWSQTQPMAQSLISQAIVSAASNAYGINVSLPATGTLEADVGNISPGMLDTVPPGTNGKQITFSYQVPGIRITFRESNNTIFGSYSDSSFWVTFDGTLQIYVVVPDNTFTPIGIKASFLTNNQQQGLDGFSLGNVFVVIDGIIDAIGKYLSALVSGNSLTGGGGSPPEQIIPISTAQFQASQALLTKGMAMLAASGFTQLNVIIDPNPPSDAAPGNTVELQITHRFDPAATLFNALAPPGPSLFGAQIGASPPQVRAGDPLLVIGNYFPAAQSNAMTVKWSDTTPGNVIESEIQWGPTADGQSLPAAPADVKIARINAYDGQNSFTASQGVQPNTWYAFRVRDYDVKSFIAMRWSDWLHIKTTATDQLQLVLQPNNLLLGYATLQSGGYFKQTVVIPSSLAAGTYPLWAVLGGQSLAQTTITVVAAGGQLQPSIWVIDPSTGIPYPPGVRLIGGGPLVVTGNGFAPGNVDFFVDSASGQSLGSVSADGSGNFTTQPPLTWPWGVIGTHAVFAQQGSKSATFAVYAENPPQ